MKAGLVIACGNCAEALHALEEVLYAVTKAVPAAVKWDWSAAGGPRWYSCPRPASREVRAQPVTIVALVRDDPLSMGRDNSFSDLEVRALPWINPNLESSTTTVDKRGELCIEPSLGAANGLKTLASSGICRVLVQFDVGGVQMPELSFGAWFEPTQHCVPQAHAIPARPAGVDTLPRAEDLGQIAPRAAGARPEDHRLDHAPVTARRTTTRRYRYRSRMALLNFFNRSQSGSRRKKRGPDDMLMTAESDNNSLCFVHS